MTNEIKTSILKAALINGGRMVGEEAVDTLRNKAPRQVHVHFNQPVTASVFDALPGVSGVKTEAKTLDCFLEGNADTLVKTLSQFPIEDILIEEPDLEDIFMNYYEGDQ